MGNSWLGSPALKYVMYRGTALLKMTSFAHNQPKATEAGRATPYLRHSLMSVIALLSVAVNKDNNKHKLVEFVFY